jgi:hypothetical protein
MSLNKGRLNIAIAALRSGLYLKGPGFLHNLREIPLEFGADYAERVRAGNPDAYPGWWCCLGVLGDVASRFGLPVERYSGGASTCENIGESNAYLTPEVAGWYGFEQEQMYGLSNNDLLLIQPDGTKVRASLWNDDAESAFEDIAQGFERTFLA